MIVSDLQALQSLGNSERGIARFTGEVAAALERLDPGLVDVYCWNDGLPYADRLHAMVPARKLRSFTDLRGLDVDVLHLNSPFELWPMSAFVPPVRARRTVATCYDLIPYRFPDKYLLDPVGRARYQARLGLLQAADALVTDSRSAADDASAMLGYRRDRITVIGAGVGDQFRPPTTPPSARLAELRRTVPTLRPGFVFAPTAMDWRKNYVGAIRAYARLEPALRRRHQLVLACRITPGQRDVVEQICRDEGVDGQVLVTGYLSDDDLVRMYQTAELVMFTSFYEGFGLPVVEARHCGARVICGDTSSLPEVMPEPLARFNPYDVDDVAAVLREALLDPDVGVLLDAAADAGFTWDRAAAALAGVYRRLAGEASDGTRVAADRPRVAVVTDLPPDPGPLAGTLEFLHGTVDVTCLVDRDWSYHVGRYGFAVESIRTLRARLAAGDVDLVVRVVGGATAVAVPPEIHAVDVVIDDDTPAEQVVERVVDSLGRPVLSARAPG